MKFREEILCVKELEWEKSGLLQELINLVLLEIWTFCTLSQGFKQEIDKHFFKVSFVR